MAVSNGSGGIAFGNVFCQSDRWVYMKGSDEFGYSTYYDKKTITYEKDNGKNVIMVWQKEYPMLEKRKELIKGLIAIDNVQFPDTCRIE